MPDSNNQRVPCGKCGVMILPLTAQLHSGLCPKCHREQTRATQDTVPIAAVEPPPPPVVMHIKTDDSAFDRRQLHLIREMVRAIKNKLQDNGIPDEKLAEITGAVAFSIAAIIDGSRVMHADGQRLIPVLTFADDDEGTKLIARPGGSSMHEYIEGTVDDIC